MDPDGRRLLVEKQYAIYAGSCVSLMQTTAQLANVTDYNKSLFGISIGAFVVNFIAALWAFSLTGVFEHNTWKIRVFKILFYFTAILSPYTAVSVLLPKKFPVWYLFAMICVIITLFKCYNMLKFSLTLTPAYENVVDATRRMFSNMTPDDQVLTDDAPAHPPLDA